MVAVVLISCLIGIHQSSPITNIAIDCLKKKIKLNHRNCKLMRSYL
jgi:hypothetical protein